MSSISTLAYRCYSQFPSNSHCDYDIAFSDEVIQTTVTNSPSAVDQWITETSYIHRCRLQVQSLLVGLDTEWRPLVPGNPVATLQLCVGRRCLIFQLVHASYVPQSLIDFLRDYRHVFVGVGVDNDASKLLNDYGLKVCNKVDLARLAHRKLPGMHVSSPGLKFLAYEVLGVDIEKPRHVTMSGWDNQKLSLEQVQYACVDAYVSFEIGRIWRAWESES